MAIQQFKTQGGVSLSDSNNFLVDQWIGPEVTFIHTNYGSEIDIIEGNTQITRGTEQGIYNPAEESGWDSNQSPVFTQWNADGWDDLSDVTTRNYTSFYAVNNAGSLGYQVVGTEYIMHDTDNDIYYTVKFTSWQSNALGGGFSYIRRQINTGVFFRKTDYGNEVDNIYIDPSDATRNVVIARDNNSGIYNPYTDDGYTGDTSPGNTLWNSEGYSDLSNVTTRQYLNWESAIKGQAGIVITGSELVMKDIINNEYWTIKFNHWTNSGSGGGFSYTRKKINTNNPPIGLKFNDGSIQTTAVTHQRLGIVPRSEIHNASYEYRITERDIGQFIILAQVCNINIPDAHECNIPIGSIITMINMSGGECSVYKNNNSESGVIYNGAGGGSSNNGWGLNSQGIFTLIKIGQYYDGYPVVEWMIAGPNLDNYC